MYIATSMIWSSDFYFKKGKHKSNAMNGGIKMKQSKDLERLLKSLDGQKYGAYKRMKGIYQLINSV